MQKGRIVEAGTWQQICETPQEAYTQRLLTATPELPAV
jgi:peptide/nickel transport system ATP-binding protein